ncbi:[FeFe] hydrogenase H-cluster maturation GTPase HydF [Vulcanibacillus modesticaldus]|uniref:[FeFe] hydrogenase H-cluster maturation GTPase HydF n=1 Tax=Vulcanibacillus modesticaldus TaxID=337097 RepID=A0A1D2YTA3_9BACI|nr:[FeFe] hydrogenase H-cluster maturation GTPase HydF [Vulcanibacillus modesticaldus]OEF98922.1 [FeFe] hydrogenase H-cluster maturation GTPase HydF [Vulcanibacillus modesticaldus]
MSLNDTPRSARIHIALFGKRNAGKSSIINALTGQDIAIVSEIKGTTTDPVYKAIEILPIGPCVLIDTAGIDDLGKLGELRIKKTMEVLNITDVALVAIDATVGITEDDFYIIDKIKEKKIPIIIILNKNDLINLSQEEIDRLEKELNVPVVAISALKNQGIKELKKKIIDLIPDNEAKFRLVGDLINPGDFVVLVTPIDKAAPKGRLILPQQQTIRDILESDAIAIVTKEYELKETLENLGKKPKLVITDSQAFLKVAADTPKDIPLTSFSILFARYNGDLEELVKGAKAIENLKDGDKVLIAEGCTHHRQSDDIGTVKIPRWIRQRTGKKLDFEFASGVSFTEDVKKYSLIVHCGACMLNRSGMLNRISTAKAFNVPIVNYGVLIAYVQGIFERALEPFPLAKMIWEDEDLDF